MSAYVTIDLPAGISRQGTPYQDKGKWYDGNLIRFFNGAIRAVGGWGKTITTPLNGMARGGVAWRDLAAKRWLALGTNNKLYVTLSGAVADITPSGFVAGRQDSLYGLGFGAGDYGKQAYGTARSSTGLVLEAATWSLDTWGQNLVACCTSDGNLYQWVPSTTVGSAAAATVISGAPTQCRSTFVTEERYQVALGAGGDPRNVSWSTQGDNTVWTPAVTNTAGSLQLSTNGVVQSGRKVRGGNLIWTDVDVHFMQYVSTPYIYGIQRLASGCGALGPRSMVSLDQMAFWMSDKGFWLYDGYVKPLPCPIQDDIFANLNVLQGAKVYCGHNGAFGEVWWFYPSAGSVECDSYASYNYRENHWNWGQLARTTWVDRGPLQYPMAVGADGLIYQHEYGFGNNGVPRNNIFLKTAVVELGSGDHLMQVQKIIGDGGFDHQSFEVFFDVQNTPTGPTTTYGPYVLNNVNGYTDARFTGRQAQMTIQAVEDADWRIGDYRLEVVQGSKR
jgi:hypothetical protein